MLVVPMTIVCIFLRNQSRHVPPPLGWQLCLHKDLTIPWRPVPQHSSCAPTNDQLPSTWTVCSQASPHTDVPTTIHSVTVDSELSGVFTCAVLPRCWIYGTFSYGFTGNAGDSGRISVDIRANGLNTRISRGFTTNFGVF